MDSLTKTSSERLRTIVEEVNESFAAFESASRTSPGDERESARRRLSRAGKLLTLEAQEPVETLFDQAFQVGYEDLL